MWGSQTRAGPLDTQLLAIAVLCRSLAALRIRIKEREARQAVFNSFCSDQRTRLGRLLQKWVAVCCS